MWTSGKTDAAQHTSDGIHASTLIGSIVGDRELSESSLDSVVFLLGRDDSGHESLSRLAGQGALPGVQKNMEAASAVHHHVNNVESGMSLAKHAGEGAVVASLDEFHRKLSGEEAKNSKKNRALKRARVLVVSVPSKDSSALDAAVTMAIESENVGTVVLTAQRSTEEVKHERKLAMVKKNSQVKAASGRRRLEDAEGADDQYYAYQAADNSMEGIYYVAITPNILAGLLFFFFFVGVTYVGVSCMGMIQGQDVYAEKYPVIGREA